ncbi:MAG: ABC transporter permease [Clostridiaceae bacterium]|nr:ABC transporter permease [Clostridiaceae bacterium]
MDANKKNVPVKNTTQEHTVRVLSPSMLVIKRFIRNKLAIVGTIIIIAMFLFSFLGGVIIPYKETETFYTTGMMVKDYASATYNRNFYYYEKEGASFSSAAQAKFVLAINNKKDSFAANGTTYQLTKESEDFYRISGDKKVASAIALKGIYSVTPEEGVTLPESFEETFIAAHSAKEPAFELDGTLYTIENAGKSIFITAQEDIALATKIIYNLYNNNAEVSYSFRLEAQRAMNEGKTEFEADQGQYLIQTDGDSVTILDAATSEPFADASNMIITPAVAGSFLSVEFKTMIANAINEGNYDFDITDAQGNTVTYSIVRRDYQFDIRTETETKLIDTYGAPSAAHPLGTDGYGMDILTRLMYGGRVSLIIGFIVVIIETVIGVILGGISGYFGRWVDQIIMRIVDIFNCIPTMPLYIIIGAIMDSMRIDAAARIMVMMAILGVTGWPGIARVVRGQILSLREQEFMLATEATGLSVSRRIFKHLVPNVIPQLIVYATMGLGSIILTEATLSFLGLGVKYPYASWGNIINAVNDVFVLTNYLYVWIPAGILILLTVLGFNFIGDGLRDAFDPKMKR